MRVKDVGVLAARNTFTLKVDKFLPASVSHDSLFSNVRLSSVKILHSFMILHRKKKKKKGFLRKVFLLEILNRTDRNSNLINHLTLICFLVNI